MELHSKQLGLIGLGRIASHVARIAIAMGMKVVAYDPYLAPEKAAEKGVQLMETLEELLGTSDVVSLHIPLTDENRKLMNAERFAQMKEGSIFINTSRGGNVDEQALIDAVEAGRFFGVGLDVTDPEPPQAGNPLLDKPNVVITPHIASATAAGQLRIYESAMDQVLMVVQRGERPPHILNPEIWPRVRERWEAQQAES